MKLKRKSKVNLWFAKAAELRFDKEAELRLAKWRATAAGEEFLAERDEARAQLAAALGAAP